MINTLAEIEIAICGRRLIKTLEIIYPLLTGPIMLYYPHVEDREPLPSIEYKDPKNI